FAAGSGLLRGQISAGLGCATQVDYLHLLFGPCQAGFDRRSMINTAPSVTRITLFGGCRERIRAVISLVIKLE
ncbi:hypothetical protein BC936DRAFT_138492, partial [Jimgerdemannia flammicorona]